MSRESSASGPGPAPANLPLSLYPQSEIQEEMPGHRGDVIVALKYTPPDGSLGRKGRKTRGRLHVMVKEAKNLAPVRSNGSADPFCKW